MRSEFSILSLIVERMNETSCLEGLFGWVGLLEGESVGESDSGLLKLLRFT